MNHEFESKHAACLLCGHRQKGFKCPAFPDGIPDEILSGENDHSKPLKSQNNKIVFTAIIEKQPDKSS